MSVEASPTGGTTLVRCQGSGQIAARRTGAGSSSGIGVHLVSTAAGPLGGDELDLRIEVGPGASLVVGSAAATMALPGPVGAAVAQRTPALVRLFATVADGGSLTWSPEPLVVCAGADIETETTVEVTGTGRVVLDERLVLGRFGEPTGRWAGRLAVLSDDRPVLRHALRHDLLPGRVLISRLLLDGIEHRAVAGESAVRCPLPSSGALVTVWAPDLATADRALDDVCPAHGATR